VSRRLVVRLDHAGDVLLAGPAVRAVAASGAPVDLLVGPKGRAAAELLPNVERVLGFDAPWMGDDAPSLDARVIEELVGQLRDGGYEEVLVLTSFHQSPLPMAMVARMAGIGSVSATCVDHPGSLLDHRVADDPGRHEVAQHLAMCAAAGHHLPAGDDGRLVVQLPAATGDPAAGAPRPYVVVHPGASVPARALPEDRMPAMVRCLVADGWHVVVTGATDETALVRRATASAPEGSTTSITGTSLGELALVLRGAAAVLVGNTGPAHLAAAVGTPVVQAFAPVVPAHRWRPWGVASVQLGVSDIACAGCRARTCPLPGQPCLAPVTGERAAAAVRELVGRPAPEPQEALAWTS
jgi:ADP-heptose:LPS heptosyltransferase